LGRSRYWLQILEQLIMRKNQFLLFALSAIVLFISSCKIYTSEVHLYTINIEVLESPEESRVTDLGHEEKIRVEFDSAVEIAEAHVILFREDANMFDIEGDNVQAKENMYLTDPMIQGDRDEYAVFATRNYSVDAMEYIFEQEVDLSIYPAGTCFVLYGIARPNDNHIGYSTESIYFCKKN